MARGIDVSSYQGYPNFGAVRGAGVEFVYIKATESNNYVSPTVDGQWSAATGAGLVCGLYHFGRPSLNNPEAEAELFSRLINAKGAKGAGHLPPCLDLEVGSGNLAWYVGRFIGHLRQMIGDVPCIVYSGGSFYRNQIGDGALPANTSAWIAHYDGTPGVSSYLTPKTVIHQFTDALSVPGAGSVDGNESLVSLDVITGGEADMQLGDQYTDWAGNVQTVQSTFDHLDQRLADLHSALLDAKPSRYTAPDGSPSSVQLNAVDAIFDNNAADYENVDRLVALTAAVNSLSSLLGSLQGLDGDEIASKVQEAVAHALAENTVHVDVEVGGQPAPTPDPTPAPDPATGAPKS